MNRLLVLAAIVFTTTACGTFVGDHPFSSFPSSSGHLDHTPDVLIARGQDDVVCATPGRELTLDYFVTFRWMQPPAEVVVWSGAVDGGGERHTVPGATELTFHLLARGLAGHLAYHQLNLAIGSRVYSTTTIVADCGPA